MGGGVGSTPGRQLPAPRPGPWVPRPAGHSLGPGLASLVVARGEVPCWARGTVYNKDKDSLGHPRDLGAAAAGGPALEGQALTWRGLWKPLPAHIPPFGPDPVPRPTPFRTPVCWGKGTWPAWDGGTEGNEKRDAGDTPLSQLPRSPQARDPGRPLPGSRTHCPPPAARCLRLTNSAIVTVLGLGARPAAADRVLRGCAPLLGLAPTP